MVLKNLISETVFFCLLFSKPGSILRMKLTHPLKQNCLIELDWDQNKMQKVEYVCLSSTLVSNER